MTKQFEFLEMDIPGAFLITPFHTTDDRGETVKAYSKELFAENGIVFESVETLYITSRKDVLRGLHFQRVRPQAKLICCISGHVQAILVDLRKDSPAFGRYACADLTGKTTKELFIPEGCAFGTLAFENSMLICQCGEKFYAEYSDGIRWDDPTLKIEWRLDRLSGVQMISAKDQGLGRFIDYSL